MQQRTLSPPYRIVASIVIGVWPGNSLRSMTPKYMTASPAALIGTSAVSTEESVEKVWPPASRLNRAAGETVQVIFTFNVPAERAVTRMRRHG